MTRLALIAAALIALTPAASAQNFTKTGGVTPAELATLTVPVETTSTLNDLVIGAGGGSVTGGFGNFAVGLNALGANTTGSTNVAIGANSLAANTTLSSNIAIGVGALRYTTACAGAIGIGYQALGGAAISTAGHTAVGYQAGKAITSGSNFVGVGYQAGAAVTTGYNDTFVGYRAGAAVTTGGDNTLIGATAAPQLTTANGVVAVGPQALNSNSTVGNIIAIGRAAGFSITGGTGSSIYIGGNAGQYIADGTTAFTTGTNNIFIGVSTKALAATESNSIAIGHTAISEGDNTTTIGNTSTTQAHIFGSLLHRRKVVNDTNGETLSASDASGVPGGANGQIYTNTGATGAQTFNLPAATAGMVCTFYVSAAQDVDVNPDNADQILGLTNAVGDAISSDAAVGSRITLIAIDATNWAAFDVGGTWTDVN